MMFLLLIIKLWFIAIVISIAYWACIGLPIKFLSYLYKIVIDLLRPHLPGSPLKSSV